MLVSIKLARELCHQVFVEKMGTPNHIAGVAIDVLVEANLRGIDSHGIGVLPYYLDKWSVGQIVPDAEPVLLHETHTTSVFDAQQAVGHYASLMAMDAAIEQAREVGISASVVKQSTHNGAISHYTIHAARQGMIGVAMTACAPHVAPHGGTSGLHGTNPISYALPRGESDPIVFDMSTGHSSAKLKDHADRDGVLSAGRMLDAAGQPTTNPADMSNGWILPVAGHIGFGLAMLVDALTAGLTDSPIGRQMPLVSDTDGPYHGSFFALAMTPSAFAGSDAFESRINELIRQVETHAPQNPNDPVRWPGQRGWREREKRIVEGIPISTNQWKVLVDDLAAHDVNVT